MTVVREDIQNTYECRPKPNMTGLIQISVSSRDGASKKPFAALIPYARAIANFGRKSTSTEFFSCFDFRLCAQAHVSACEPGPPFKGPVPEPSHTTS